MEGKVHKMTYRKFAELHKIHITAVRHNENPNMPAAKDMHHWKCSLTYGVPKTILVKQMTVHFSKGYGHNGAPPTVEEVLECLASDAAEVNNHPNLADWCKEYGYTDRLQAYSIFYNVVRQSVRLREFLGEELYNTLLWETT